MKHDHYRKREKEIQDKSPKNKIVTINGRAVSR